VSAPVCAACGKPSTDLRYVDGKIVCATHAGPPTVDNPNCGPKVCAKCAEPVHHRSGEDLCERCLWTERGAS
jgi:formylmethanofuran dehydrogenase subunit E